MVDRGLGQMPVGRSGKQTVWPLLFGPVSLRRIVILRILSRLASFIGLLLYSPAS
jgi:hypothetical protein